MTLIDEHDAAISDGTVRDHVARQRRHAEWTNNAETRISDATSQIR